MSGPVLRRIRIVWIAYMTIALVLMPINSYHLWKTRESFGRWLLIDNMNAAACSVFWPIALPYQFGWISK